METLLKIVEATLLIGALFYSVFILGNLALLIAGKRQKRIEGVVVLTCVVLWTIWLYMRGIL